ncbi:MAG: hypothetical protein Q4C95_02325 [Planctomycetia bacterium]|nr:hypothetical protein [Planctomycetia bacterium]
MEYISKDFKKNIFDLTLYYLNYFVKFSFLFVLSIFVNDLFFFSLALDQFAPKTFSNDFSNRKEQIISNQTFSQTDSSTYTKAAWERSDENQGLFRVNISWSTEEPQLWFGEITLSSGFFSDSIPLANDPTSPVVFHTENEARGKICFRTLSPALYCGVQTTIYSSKNDCLIFNLTNIHSRKAIQKTIQLESLINESCELMLQSDNNESKNNVVINMERIPGDELPVRIAHANSNRSFEKTENMIFEPGESLILSVFPRFLSVPFQDNLSLMVQVNSKHNEQVYCSETKELSFDSQQGQYDFTLPLPDTEGVFNIKIFLQKTNKQKSFSIIIPNRETEKQEILAQRTAQGIVVSSNNIDKFENNNLTESDFDLRDGIIETIDPSNPVWWKVFARRSLISNFKKNDSTFDPDSNDKTNNNQQKNKQSDNYQNFQNTESTKNNIVDKNEWKSEFSHSELIFPETNAFANDNQQTILGQYSLFPSKKENSVKNYNNDWLKKWNFGGIQTQLNSIKLGNWGQWEDLWKNSRGSGHLQPYSTQNSQFETFVQLMPSFNPEVIPWESYSIPVKEPGKPHLLEIEYISNIPQTLGISILEPSVTGGIFPLSLDYGLVVPDDPLSDQMPNRIMRYQILFWPKSKTPIILLMNRQPDKPAVFGRIRIYRSKEKIAAFQTSKRGRSVAAMMTRPNFCDQFAALRVDSSVGVIGAEDWNTVFDSIQRMTQYLQFVGYDSLMLSAIADGSSLYPSSLLNPSPKFDSGIFLKNGEDPVRKDILEVIARIFDSKQLSIIPLIDFNTPLPTLEEQFRNVCQQANKSSLNALASTTLQQGTNQNLSNNSISLTNIHSNPSKPNDPNDQSTIMPEFSTSFDSIQRMEGIYWIGPDGRLLIESRKTNSGTGPYYNILHPLVQETILNIVREIVARYGQHRSFGGIAIQLSTNGFAQLPDDIFYGMDDETITRFARETNLQENLLTEKKVSIEEFLTISGLKKYRFRAQFIKEYCQEEWIKWRSETVHQFYEKVHQTIAERRPDTKLYLVGTNMLDGKISRSQLYPTLTQQTNLDESIRRIGFDLDLFSKNSSITFLRPGFVTSTSKLNQMASLMEFDSNNAISLFSKNLNNTGAFFYHLPKAQNIESFDQASPFHPTITQIETRAVASDYENKRRFMNQLSNCDTFYFFDGGAMIPMGAETSLRDFISVFKEIPLIPFKTWTTNKDSNGNEKTIQPIILRYSQTKKETWVYLLNNAPFHTKVRFSMKYQPNAQFELLGKKQNDSLPLLGVDSFVWSMTLNPFDLTAFRLSDPKATVDYIDVSCPNEICGPNGRLASEVQDFVDRVLIARLGVETIMRNADFDELVHSENGHSESLAQQDSSIISQSAVPTNSKSKTVLGLEMPKMNLLKNPFENFEKKGETPQSPLNSVINTENNIPGWRHFGDPQFIACLDSENRKNGQFSLKLSSRGEVGGIISEPFIPPTTGRLCVQLYFGVAETEKSLPLRICLTGRYRGAPYSRLLSIGPTILQRIQEAQANNEIEPVNGLLWFQDVILFDRLPLDELEDISLRFDLLSQGTVWVDQIRLYKLAFADLEQNELMRLINTVEYRVDKNRVIDSMNLLNGYWARLLEEQIPDNSALMANRPPHTPRSAQQKITEKRSEEKESRNFLQKMMFWK